MCDQSSLYRVVSLRLALTAYVSLKIFLTFRSKTLALFIESLVNGTEFR